MQAILNEMIDNVMRHADGHADILPHVRIRIRPNTSNLDTAIYRPMLCIVLQGVKQVVIGDQILHYDPASYFVSYFNLPGSGRVLEASPDRPFISVSLAIEIEQVVALLPEAPPFESSPAVGFAVAPITPQLLDPWRRLLQLLDTPDDAPSLAPLFEREIVYRLLREPQGCALRQLACSDSRSSQVHNVIEWIRTHYREPLKVDQLAEMAAMSVPSLHRHFKTATGTSPLQFQKSLRLQQARIQLRANENATSAAYAVGYESLSQFSREYTRMFGAPPLRDARRLNQNVA